jgi:hypothetical protein
MGETSLKLEVFTRKLEGILDNFTCGRTEAKMVGMKDYM